MASSPDVHIIEAYRIEYSYIYRYVRVQVPYRYLYSVQVLVGYLYGTSTTVLYQEYTGQVVKLHVLQK